MFGAVVVAHRPGLDLSVTDYTDNLYSVYSCPVDLCLFGLLCFGSCLWTSDYASPWLISWFVCFVMFPCVLV